MNQIVIMLYSLLAESKEKGDHRLGFLTLEHRNA